MDTRQRQEQQEVSQLRRNISVSLSPSPSGVVCACPAPLEADFAAQVCNPPMNAGLEWQPFPRHRTACQSPCRIQSHPAPCS
eukprot:3479944-Amphidinium_carterae.1